MSFAKGTTFRFYVNTGTDSTPVLTAVGKETDVTVDFSVDTIDTTNKSSGIWKEHEESFREMSVSGTAHMDIADTAVEKLFTDMIAGTARRAGMQIKTVNGKIFTFTGTNTSLSQTSPHDGIIGLNFNFISSGAVTRA